MLNWGQSATPHLLKVVNFGKKEKSLDRGGLKWQEMGRNGN